MPNTEENYRELARILKRAYDQAATGKGHQRHARKNEPWHEQHIIVRGRVYRGGCLYQADKKAEESLGLDRDAAIRELLGAICYLAAEVYILETEGDALCPDAANEAPTNS
jgi:hypothetical protein